QRMREEHEPALEIVEAVELTWRVAEVLERERGWGPARGGLNRKRSIAICGPVVLAGEGEARAMPGQLPAVARNGDRDRIHAGAEEPDDVLAGFTIGAVAAALAGFPSGGVGAVVCLPEARARPRQPGKPEVAIEKRHDRDQSPAGRD